MLSHLPSVGKHTHASTTMHTHVRHRTTTSFKATPQLHCLAVLKKHTPQGQQPRLYLFNQLCASLVMMPSLGFRQADRSESWSTTFTRCKTDFTSVLLHWHRLTQPYHRCYATLTSRMLTHQRAATASDSLIRLLSQTKVQANGLEACLKVSNNRCVAPSSPRPSPPLLFFFFHWHTASVLNMDRGLNTTGYPLIVCGKQRIGETRIVTIHDGDAKGRRVLIVDDMVRSGGQ